MGRILTGFSNGYIVQVYENNKISDSVDLLVIIKSAYKLDENKICKALRNIKSEIKRYYNKQFKWKHPMMNTTEIYRNNYQGIAKYNIKIKEIKNG